MSRQDDYQKRRRQRGLCKREGCSVLSGEATHCPRHAKDHTRYAAGAWRRRRERGLCGWGGCPVVSGSAARCPKHAAICARYCRESAAARRREREQEQDKQEQGP